jgi:serine/alanine adding enzyme
VREVPAAEWVVDYQVEDAYYRRAYVESACVLEPGEPLLLEHDETVFAAIRRREPVDLITPYGYGGPAGGDLAAFWPAYDAWCREHGVVTTFLRFHPLLGNQVGAPIHVEELAPTIGWRLDGDLLAGMHQKHRNVVRKADKAGLAVEQGTGVGEFQVLYEETMRRADAAAFYFFAAEYWAALDRLGDGLLRFEARARGDVVASALCLASPPFLHYHLGAASDAGRKLGATTFLLYEIARWAQEHGYARFHLGGGVGGGRDSLHEFKRRFDPGGECPMAIGKAVHDAEAYRALGGDAAELSGFFPAYRR